MSNTEKRIVDLLHEIGLPFNVSKAYISLLKNSPCTGYEISANSGIPRSAIYSVLKRLDSIGLINSVGTSPKKYIPIPPSSLLEHLTHLHTDRMTDLQTALDSIDVDEEVFDFWHIHGYRNLIYKLRETINNAEEKLFLSIWAKEMKKVLKELKKAQNRGIEITLFSFCKLPKKLNLTVTYDLEENELLNVWKPKIICVADQRTTVMGSTDERRNCQAILTNNLAITEIATNHIILDITLAGKRLDFDANPIVKRVMKRPDIHLDPLLRNPVL